MIYGRDRERAKLRELLDDAIEGHASLVLISGEAGIGKTALVDDLIFTARERGCIPLTGSCYDLTTTPPYGPWIEVLQSYSPGEDGPAMPSWFGNPEEFERVGSQARLFEQARSFFISVAEWKPLVIVLEDLHWSDSASLDALRSLSRRLDIAPWLLVGTYREDEIIRDHQLSRMIPAIVRESSATRLRLMPLDESAVRMLIMQRHNLNREDLERLSKHISSLAEGNALYVVEMLQTLEDVGSLQVTSGRTEVGALDQIVVPPLIGRLIEERLERLGAGAVRALGIAAIIGQEFDYELWQTVSEADANLLLVTLEAALHRRLIEETERNGRYRFTHALIREALYKRQIWPRRRHWHLQIAEALASQHQPDPGAVAHHFQQAGDKRAIEWLISAGDAATRTFAFVEALNQYSTAIRLEPKREESLQHGWLLARLAYVCVRADLQQGLEYAGEAAALARQTGDRALAVWTRWRRAWLKNNIGENGLDDLVEVRDTLQKLSDDEREILSDHLRSVFGFDAHQLDRVVSATLAEWFADYGRYEEALRQADILLDGAPDETLRYEDSDGYMARAIAATALGQPAMSRQAFARAHAICLHNEEYYALVMTCRQELRDTVLVYETDQLLERRRLVEQILTAHWVGVNRGTLADLPPEWGIVAELYLQGDWKTACEAADKAIAIGGIWSRLVEPIRGQIAYHQGDSPLAAWIVKKMVPNGIESSPDNQYYDSTLPAIRLAIELACDQLDLGLARAWLATYERWLGWSKRIQGQAESHLLKAKILRLDGDYEQAHDEASSARLLARRPRQPLALIAANRFLGQLDVDEKKHIDARGNLNLSLKLAERCEAPFEQALTLAVMAENARKMEEVDEVRRLLTKIREICDPLDAKPILERMHELEDLLPETHVDTVEYPFGLTARQVEVLRLVARGQTDAEAAEKLFISPRTVSQHLRNAYDKLGVNNRTEATRVVVEHGII